MTSIEEFMDESVNDMLQDLRNIVSCFSRAAARADDDGYCEVDTCDIKELEVVSKALESYLLLSK